VKGKWIGIGIIAMGVILLLRNVLHIEYDLTLFVIGGLFIAAYLAVHKGPQKNIGFLIPGSILIFLGFNDLVEKMNFLPKSLESMAPLVFIGLAFLTIYLVSAALGPKTAHWALLVGVIVLAMAAITFIVENHWIPAEVVTLYGIPVLLIFIGLLILFGALRRGRKMPPAA
jgi:hypothetical protein